MDVTTETFDADVLDRSSETPVVVDFWAEWCGPCRTLAPLLEQAIADRDGAVELAKVDVDAEPDLARRYGIRGIPAVKAFRRGQVVKEFVGAVPRAAVESFLDSLTEPSALSGLVAELQERGDRSDVVAALEREDYEQALELLLGGFDEAGPEEREDVRRLMVAIFDELGQEHPLSSRYRRRLATALY